MPRLTEAMKDVISCDKPRVDANNLWSEDFRMGEPDYLSDGHPYLIMGANAGNWNILVPVGKENNLMIPLVVASERGKAQTYDVVMRDRGSRVTISYFESEENVLESSII